MAEKDKVEETKKETKKETTTKKTTNKKATTKKTNTTTKTNTKSKAEKTVDKIAKNVTKPATRKKRDMNEMVSVICITNTPLVYTSKNQVGYRVDWGGFLEENWMEYKELINMRNSQRAFFEEPWVICEWDVLVDLKVDQYYKNIIDLENLDAIFEKSPEELERTLKIVPDGIKKLIVDRAFELRREKKLDSLNTIEVIEDTLNIDLSI